MLRTACGRSVFVTDSEAEGELSVSFDGRLVTYGFGELDALAAGDADVEKVSLQHGVVLRGL
jgi:hypothetical protein